MRKPKELKTHTSSQSLDSSHEELAPNRYKLVFLRNIKIYLLFFRFSPTASLTSFSLDEQSSVLNSTPNVINPVEPSSPSFHTPAPPVVTSPTSAPENNEVNSSNDENNAEKNDSDSMLHTSKEHKERDDHREKVKAEKKAAKKLIKEITICKIILEEMEVNQNYQVYQNRN